MIPVDVSTAAIFQIAPWASTEPVVEMGGILQFVRKVLPKSSAITLHTVAVHPVHTIPRAMNLINTSRTNALGLGFLTLQLAAIAVPALLITTVRDVVNCLKALAPLARTPPLIALIT